MNIHFIAIGGSAMHNLALALHQKGDVITGSDDIIYEPSKTRLSHKGLLPEKEGWVVEKISPDLDAVILGMHAKADNPELLRAKELGLKIYSYPEFIYEQCKHKTRVVIGGSHGKTTITAMILHVMQYHNRDVDYMVGAQLESFEVMVKLTDTNDFVVLEGDEYLSSAIDPRPKFHLYQPNIALLSGIAWDHINVFPSYDEYVSQFAIFIDSIVKGGSITYNEEDTEVTRLVEASQNNIRKIPYHTPSFTLENGTTMLHTSEGALPIEIFGKHNLSNIAGAKWICQHMGIDENDFFEAITTFKGANKRLEKIAETATGVIYKDFAHAPSKVAAATHAVKTQYKNKTLIACLELHTYSSLNLQFLDQYRDTLAKAEVAVVYYSPQTVALKQLEPISPQQIRVAFNREDLIIYTNTSDFKDFIYAQDLDYKVLLLMSSGNFGGLNFKTLKEPLTHP